MFSPRNSLPLWFFRVLIFYSYAFLVTECGPQNEIQIQKGSAALRRAQRRRNRRQCIHRQRIIPEIRPRFRRHSDTRTTKSGPCDRFHGREPFVMGCDVVAYQES